MTTFFLDEATGKKLFEQSLQVITPQVGTLFILEDRNMHVVKVALSVVARYNGPTLISTVILRDGIL